jgi:RsiW-degrading membrane proteinase PrsW (M82 family)
MYILSLIPPLLLCWYIYTKDRIEKEPIGLLLVLFLAGGVIYLPAIYAENAIIGFIDKLFETSREVSVSGYIKFTSEGAFTAHSILCGFLATAIIEEGAKWLILYFLTFKNKHFSHLFDGVVYSVFVSLGFAVCENLRFAISDGWNTFILRISTSLPSHMIFGVIMGVVYTAWHMYYLAKMKEKILVDEGTLTQKEKPIRSGGYLALSFVLPFVLHGLYSFARFYTSESITIIFYVIIMILFALSFILIRWLSATDSIDDEVAYRLLTLKYPQLKNVKDTTLDELEEIEEKEYFQFPPADNNENEKADSDGEEEKQ